jgi:hypothetical protein
MRNLLLNRIRLSFVPKLGAALLLVGVALRAANPAQPVREILLVHFTHTDIGFTDHPVVARELQRRYLDIALDAAIATRNRPPSARFYWTTEAASTLDEWWREQTRARRALFLECVRAGQIDVTALPFNNTPFLNREQWDTMVNWLPERLWTQSHPKVAMQDDVNGFPRAGAQVLLKRGIRLLWTGINSDSGGPPSPAPAAFWWKAPGDSPDAAAIAGAVMKEPVVAIIPGGREEPLYLRWLYKP